MNILKKPTFYKLLYFIREDENKFLNNYLRIINGIWGQKKKLARSDEIDINVVYYKEKAEELIQNSGDHNDLVEIGLSV